MLPGTEEMSIRRGVTLQNYPWPTANVTSSLETCLLLKILWCIILYIGASYTPQPFVKLTPKIIVDSESSQ